MTAQAKGGPQVASKCVYLDEFVSHAKKSTREKLKDKFTQMSLDRGQFIFFEGDDAAALYLVESGVIEANVIHGDGKVYIFHFIFPGDIFGEGVVYGQQYYLFSAVARKEATVWKIAKDDLIPLLESDTDMERHILRLVGKDGNGLFMLDKDLAARLRRAGAKD